MGADLGVGMVVGSIVLLKLDSGYLSAWFGASDGVPVPDIYNLDVRSSLGVAANGTGFLESSCML